MAYESGVNTLDVSNSNTPNPVDPTNPVTSQVQRAVGQIDANGNLVVTPVNAYSGNNGRAVVLGNTGTYYMVGNAGNSGKGATGTIFSELSDNTGVQMVNPGGGPNTTVVGQVNGTFGNATGYQRGFAVGQINPLTGLPYGPDDKTGKDDNFRGETIFNNTLYVTKGSGGNGVDTVYQVGTAGSLPTFANAGTTPITVLPGLPAGLAANIVPGDPATEFFPFGIWFANSTTLYVADEGSGKNTASDNPTNDPNNGLEKWSLVNGAWRLDYTLKNGLNLGVQYSIPNGPNGEVYPANLNPATDGLRNLTGRVNGDGTVTLYAITSTVSASGDQGADPNKLVAITDDLSATALPASEQFVTLRSARYGEVLRGVTFTPNPTLDDYKATIEWGDGSATTTGTISLSGATFTVSGQHTYGEEGSYPITTTITHIGISTPVVGTANVAEAAVVATPVPVFAVECRTNTVNVATFTDPGGVEPNPSDPNGTINDHYKIDSIDWGDGTALDTSSGTISLSDSTFTVAGTHSYSEEGTYTVTTVIDHEGVLTTVQTIAVIKDDLGLLLLDPSRNQSLFVTGFGAVDATGCGAVVVDSTSAVAANVSAFGTVTAQDIDVTGGAVAQGGGSFSVPVDHEAATPDPFGLALPPAPANTFGPVLYFGNAPLTLNPGTYVGGVQLYGSGQVTLNPGGYYMQGGGFKVGGAARVSGSNVLIVNAPVKPSDEIDFAGPNSVNLSGLTSGPYQGLVILQDPNSIAVMRFVGQTSVTLSGVVYAPHAQVLIQGTASVTVNPGAGTVVAEPAIDATLIAYDLMVTDHGLLTINADFVGGTTAHGSATVTPARILSDPGLQQAAAMLGGTSMATAQNPTTPTSSLPSNRVPGSTLGVGQPVDFLNNKRAATDLSGGGMHGRRQTRAPAGPDPFGELEPG
jgi:hypothetical protein